MVAGSNGERGVADGGIEVLVGSGVSDGGSSVGIAVLVGGETVFTPQASCTINTTTPHANTRYGNRKFIPPPRIRCGSLTTGDDIDRSPVYRNLCRSAIETCSPIGLSAPGASQCIRELLIHVHHRNECIPNLSLDLCQLDGGYVSTSPAESCVLSNRIAKMEEALLLDTSYIFVQKTPCNPIPYFAGRIIHESFVINWRSCKQ
jgi:hypothetical protein